MAKSSIRKKYTLYTGVFITLCILTSLVLINTTQLDQGLFAPLVLVISTIFLFITYYLVVLQYENKKLQLKLIENEIAIAENSQTLIDETERAKHFSMIIEQSHNAVMVTDAAGKIEYVNEKFVEITGYNLSELLGQNSQLVQPVWVSKTNKKEFMEKLENGHAWRSKVNYRKKNGDTYWAFESVSFMKDDSGNVTHFLSTHRDISKEYELSEKLNYQVSHDDLTSLVNRREFERRVDKLLKSTNMDEEEHVLCFMDLDQFKVVNDTCGHVAGDELLRQLSTLLLKTVRKKDTLARIGGDEFAVLFENCTIKNAYRATSAILEAIQNFQFSWEDRSFKLGASIGLVEIKGTMFAITDILKAADTACYMAKDAGRNRIQVYQAEDSQMMQRQGEMLWVTRINEALDKNLFCLYAQIISSVQEGSSDHYEFLIRMEDKEGGIVPPGAFLPCAERYNLISKLDRWVIYNAFKFIANNNKFTNRISFCSINLSGQSLTEDDFLDYVITNLQEFKISSGKICFEITETAAISNLNVAIKFITTLKEMGCRFALDDFGSGLSSFGYLKNLPVDYLKIDGIFVKDIVDDPIDRAMVKSIHEIGHVMGMKTIAEFVENDAIKEMLKEIGVDYVQGYGIGKPMPLSELADEQDSYNLVSNY